MRTWGLLFLVVTALLVPAPANASTAPGTPVAATATPVTAVAPQARVGSRAPRGVATRIHWTRWSDLVVYGHATRLAGQVVSRSGFVARARVELLARRVGRRHWRRVDTATSSRRTGVFRFHDHVPVSRTDYRVVFRGDAAHRRTHATRRVPVARRMHDSMRRVDSNHFVFRGQVAPAYRGRRILLERRTCRRCDWATVKVQSTSRTSRWRFEVAGPTSRRTWRYRAAIAGNRLFVRSYSAHTWSIRQSR